MTSVMDTIKSVFKRKKRKTMFDSDKFKGEEHRKSREDRVKKSFLKSRKNKEVSQRGGY